MEAFEGVEEERLASFAVILVRREHAGGEEGLGDDDRVAAPLGLVQGLVERGAGVLPPAELHKCVALSHQSDRAHRTRFRIRCEPNVTKELRDRKSTRLNSSHRCISYA